MKKDRTRHLMLIFVLAAGLMATGCATRSMTLKENVSTLDTSTKSIALFTLKTANNVSPMYQAYAKEFWLKLPGLSNSPVIGFKIDKPYNEVKNQSNEYLVSVSAEPRDYLFERINGKSHGILVLGSSFLHNFGIEFELEPDSIVYLGHIDMVNRKKMPGEPAAGPLFPLFDQGAAGYFKGTFDITITDRYDEDMAMFRSHFPVLNGREIKKVILKQ